MSSVPPPIHLPPADVDRIAEAAIDTDDGELLAICRRERAGTSTPKERALLFALLPEVDSLALWEPDE